MTADLSYAAQLYMYIYIQEKDDAIMLKTHDMEDGFDMFQCLIHIHIQNLTNILLILSGTHQNHQTDWGARANGSCSMDFGFFDGVLGLAVEAADAPHWTTRRDGVSVPTTFEGCTSPDRDRLGTDLSSKRNPRVSLSSKEH